MRKLQGMIIHQDLENLYTFILINQISIFIALKLIIIFSKKLGWCRVINYNLFFLNYLCLNKY